MPVIGVRAGAACRLIQRDHNLRRGQNGRAAGRNGGSQIKIDRRPVVDGNLQPIGAADIQAASSTLNPTKRTTSAARPCAAASGDNPSRIDPASLTVRGSKAMRPCGPSVGEISSNLPSRSEAMCAPVAVLIASMSRATT